jgi:hypothetical protein
MVVWNAVGLFARDRDEPAQTDRKAPFSAAFVLEAGAAFALLDFHGIGLLLMGGAGVWITWMLRDASPQPARLAGHAAGAFVLTLFCLMPLVPGVGGFLPWFGGGGDEQKPGAPTALAKAADPVVVEEMEVHKGVILYPELKPYTVLAPPLPALSRSLFRQGATEPLSVPFFGVYWVYRWPATAPPKGSFTLRANPTDASFHSNDFHPLRMEARQNMGRMIATNCCRRIDAVIRNTDPFKDTVQVDLVLINTQLARQQSEVLPAVRVTNWSGRGEETLRFPLSGNAVLREFDELVLRYKLLLPRGTRSARIDVERFVFVPQAGR